MQHYVRKLTDEWISRDDDEAILGIVQIVECLAGKLFHDYEPSQVPTFGDRFAKWLQNVSDDSDRKLLFKLVSKIFFVGRAEFESLCRAALAGPISRWVIDTSSIDIRDPSAGALLEKEIANTWFCPITDSLRINAFLKVNGLGGKEHRPDWRSMKAFGDVSKLRAFVSSAGIKRLVLLEDFVGTGTQMEDALRFAAETLPDIPVLGCPLVICPDGVDKGVSIKGEYENLDFAPVLSLASSQMMPFDAGANEDPFVAEIRDLIRRVEPSLSYEGDDTHGFGGKGSLVVQYSNCPDNSLLIIFDQNSNWSPLFPRMEREYH